MRLLFLLLLLLLLLLPVSRDTFTELPYLAQLMSHVAATVN